MSATTAIYSLQAAMASVPNPELHQCQTIRMYYICWPHLLWTFDWWHVRPIKSFVKLDYVGPPRDHQCWYLGPPNISKVFLLSIYVHCRNWHLRFSCNSLTICWCCSWLSAYSDRLVCPVGHCISLNEKRTKKCVQFSRMCKLNLGRPEMSHQSCDRSFDIQ